MMATQVQLASRRAATTIGTGDSVAPFLRGAITIVSESERRCLASADRALAWPRLAEHGTAHPRVMEPMTPATRRSARPTRGGADGDRTSDLRLGATESAETALPEPNSPEARQLRSRIVEQLYTSSYHRVFCFVRRFTNDDEAEEIAHEAFVRLLLVRNLERMSISVAYLLRIAENLLKRRHGRAQRYREILAVSGRVGPGAQDAVGQQGAGAQHSDARSLIDGIDPERIEAVLQMLTPAEQTAIRLIVCQGMEYDAAARSIGVPVSTINNWKHRALTKLKRFVEGSEQRGSGRSAASIAC